MQQQHRQECPPGSWAAYSDTTPDTNNETTMTRVGENEIDLLVESRVSESLENIVDKEQQY